MTFKEQVRQIKKLGEGTSVFSRRGAALSLLSAESIETELISEKVGGGRETLKYNLIFSPSLRYFHEVVLHIPSI